jgi:hypothetical protein
LNISPWHLAQSSSVSRPQDEIENVEARISAIDGIASYRGVPTRILSMDIFTVYALLYTRRFSAVFSGCIVYTRIHALMRASPLGSCFPCRSRLTTALTTTSRGSSRLAGPPPLVWGGSTERIRGGSTTCGRDDADPLSGGSLRCARTPHGGRYGSVATVATVP